MIDTSKSVEEQKAEMLAAFNEPLDPELQSWVEDGPIGPMLKHPLVYQIGIINGWANRSLRYKQEALTRATEERDWHTVVFLHERPWRADALYKLVQVYGDAIPDEEFWRLVGSVWTDSENIWQNELIWEDLLGSSRTGREQIMDEDEREVLAGLPETITIYRGCQAELNEDGLSWTLDRNRAAWFAKRFADQNPGEPVVHVGEVDKPNVVAYFDARNEAEIVVNAPDSVRYVRMEEPDGQ